MEPLYIAMRQHGLIAFDFRILCDDMNREEALDLERSLIIHHHASSAGVFNREVSRSYWRPELARRKDRDRLWIRQVALLTAGILFTLKGA